MIKLKLKEWLKRYFLAEIVGTITALGAASICRVLYENSIVVAFAGSLGEAIGFYSTVFAQNILSEVRNTESKTFTLSTIIRIIFGMITEFGPAGMLDGLLLRPFFMVLFPMLLENFVLGIVIGKIAGDVTFYILVILSYEIKKRR